MINFSELDPAWHIGCMARRTGRQGMRWLAKRDLPHSNRWETFTGICLTLELSSPFKGRLLHLACRAKDTTACCYGKVYWANVSLKLITCCLREKVISPASQITYLDTAWNSDVLHLCMAGRQAGTQPMQARAKDGGIISELQAVALPGL